jgi:glutamate-1-semialdehyde 2,1-aminomutase
MAACIATIESLKNEDGVSKLIRAGMRLREGLATQAKSHSLLINQTGPAQMTMVTFAQDKAFAMANLWTGEAAKRGVYLHPWHNMFTCSAHTDADIDQALLVTDEAFSIVRSKFGAN